MGKALIIAEKPSVAADISKALGGFKKDASGDFFEGATQVVSSAVGHLLELGVPEEHDVKKGKWTFTHLPHIPPRFELKPIEKSAARLRVLQKLIKRKDVDLLINACDAGREGELIFRRIVEFTKAKQPVQRLWLQSMTPEAIREGFARLRTDVSMHPLRDAAICRAEADWLVGINGTRVMTAFNSKQGGFFLTTVGRVQTPTLAIVVEREEKIRRFVSKDYWEVHGVFAAQAGNYEGRWFDEGFTKEQAAAAITGVEANDLRAERLWERERAEAIAAKCLGKTGVVTEESKPTTQISPLLYDLNSLQREANSRFGFSAANTLKIAQALYERHKALTYPRTDSRALPEDYIPTVKQTLGALRGTQYSAFASAVLDNDWVRPNKRVFNNAKVSDHFAIIPTAQPPRNLTEPEAKIYDMVAKRFLAVFHPAAEFLVTTRITRVEGEPFKSEGKVMKNPGWLAVYGRDVAEEGSENDKTLVPVQPEEQVGTSETRVEGSATKPPPRFNEATLLGAMEGAGKLVTDEELREAMADKGLGTPATRAAIIEGLVWEKYIVRHGKELVPTTKAFLLIALLRGIGVNELCLPELTGDWEFKLRQIQRGQLDRPQFMDEIAAMTREIVNRTKGYKGEIEIEGPPIRAKCPKCGGGLKETYRNFKCTAKKCDFYVPIFVAGRIFEPEEVEELLTKGTIGPLDGFRSKMGRPFSAILKLSPAPDFKTEFDFGPQPDGETEAVDFTGQEPLGACPKCGARVFDHGMNFICEKATGPTRSCDFRMGKVILQQPIERAQVVKLLAEKKTDRLDKFISKKNNRAFKAFLVLKDDGKVGFEFEKREPRAGRERKPKEPEPKLDFTGQTPLGKCPKCDANVFEGPEHYVCERRQAAERPCSFRTGRVVCQQPVSREQVAKLLDKGRTDVFTKFISKAGRPFSASLVLQESGKVGFEFANPSD